MTTPTDIVNGFAASCGVPLRLDEPRSQAPTTREEARAAGQAAVETGQVPMHDIGGHLRTIGIPLELQGAYMAGIDDALEEMGVDTDPDSDGHGWERRALSGIE